MPLKCSCYIEYPLNVVALRACGHPPDLKFTLWSSKRQSRLLLLNSYIAICRYLPPGSAFQSSYINDLHLLHTQILTPQRPLHTPKPLIPLIKTSIHTLQPRIAPNIKRQITSTLYTAVTPTRFCFGEEEGFLGEEEGAPADVEADGGEVVFGGGGREDVALVLVVVARLRDGCVCCVVKC